MKVVPHLWFDAQAVAAAAFYADVFPDSAVNHTARLVDTPAGDCDLVSFTVWGMPFEAISGGPMFSINPSISFIVNFDPLRWGEGDAAKSEAMAALDAIWARLIEGGKALMPLDTYPFSERYGWVEDKYGVSWQLMLTQPEGDPRPPIVPTMLFTGDNYGKAEAARSCYLSVFKHSTPGSLVHYGEGQPPHQAGTVMFSDMALGDMWLAMMDAPGTHDFSFNEGVSLIVYCEDQAEVDHYWDSLIADPDSGQCGWLKDAWGVSWQMVPSAMHAMLYDSTPAQIDRVMRTAFTQKKFDIAALEAAFQAGN